MRAAALLVDFGIKWSAGRRRPKRQIGTIMPYPIWGRRELCVHDEALRVGGFLMLLSRMDALVVRGGSVT